MRELFYIPNQLSFLRIFLVPVFVTALIYGRMKLGFLIFFAAAVTDALDGFFARRLNQRTVIGSILDPLADKVLMSSAYILLAEKRLVPAWLTVAVVSRDVILVGGVIILRLFSVNGLRIEPSKLGKATTFFQILTVIFAMASEIIKTTFFFMPTLFFVTLILTVLSGYQYFKKGLSFIQNAGENYKGRA